MFLTIFFILVLLLTAWLAFVSIGNQAEPLEDLLVDYDEATEEDRKDLTRRGIKVLGKIGLGLLVAFGAIAGVITLFVGLF